MLLIGVKDMTNTDVQRLLIEKQVSYDRVIDLIKFFLLAVDRGQGYSDNDWSGMHSYCMREFRKLVE